MPWDQILPFLFPTLMVLVLVVGIVIGIRNHLGVARRGGLFDELVARLALEVTERTDAELQATLGRAEVTLTIAPSPRYLRTSLEVIDKDRYNLAESLQISLEGDEVRGTKLSGQNHLMGDDGFDREIALLGTREHVALTMTLSGRALVRLVVGELGGQVAWGEVIWTRPSIHVPADELVELIPRLAELASALRVPRSEKKSVRRLLENLRSEPNPNMVGFIAEVLFTAHADRKGIAKVAAQLGRHASARARICAATFLSDGGRRVLDSIEEDGAGELVFRTVLGNAPGRIEPPLIREAALEALRLPSPALQASACRALERCGDLDVIPMLSEVAASSPSEPIAVEAARAAIRTIRARCANPEAQGGLALTQPAGAEGALSEAAEAGFLAVDESGRPAGGEGVSA